MVGDHINISYYPYEYFPYDYETQDLDSLASGLSSCLTWLDMSRSKTLRRGWKF